MSEYEAPEYIYLQPDEPEITWGVDRIHNSDVQYVRADISNNMIRRKANKIRAKDAELARLREALSEAKRNLTRGIIIPKDIADSIDDALNHMTVNDSKVTE